MTHRLPLNFSDTKYLTKKRKLTLLKHSQTHSLEKNHSTHRQDIGKVSNCNSEIFRIDVHFLWHLPYSSILLADINGSCLLYTSDAADE